MSSILDALRKLEEEKAAAAQSGDIAIDDAIAERELMGGRPWPSGKPLRLSPAMLAVAGLAIAALVLSASIGTAVFLTRGQSAPVMASVSPSPPPAETAAPATAVETTDTSLAPAGQGPEETRTLIASTRDAGDNAPIPPPRQPSAEPLSSKELPRTTSKPAPPEPQEPVQPQSSPVAGILDDSSPMEPRQLAQRELPDPFANTGGESPATTSETDHGDDSASASLQQEPEPAPASAAKEPMPKNISSLPPLTQLLRSQYKLDDKELQMPMPRDENHAVGSAVIDMLPTYEGETIRGTNAKIVAVERHGIAVEIMGTGDRYYWRFR